jgi:hypothetical protein
VVAGGFFVGDEVGFFVGVGDGVGDTDGDGDSDGEDDSVGVGPAPTASVTFAGSLDHA